MPHHVLCVCCSSGIKIEVMKVKRDNCLSQPLQVGNGVRQRRILRPHLFAVYMGNLSRELKKVHMGCFIGKLKFNHIVCR